MKRSLLFASVFALLQLSSCTKEAAPTPSNTPQPPPNEVWVTPKQMATISLETAPVAPQSVGGQLSATGRVTFADDRVAHVFSPVTGRVTTLLTAVGQQVQKGQTLAIIDSPDIGSAVSDEQKASAALAAAKRDFDRQKELLAGHAAAQRDYEAAESTWLQAKAEHERAAAKVQLLGGRRSGGQEYALRAPIAGDIVARNVTPGVELQGQYSGGSAPELFTIGNLNVVWVIADVFEIDIPRVRIGAPVDMTVVSYPGQIFHGTVDWISGAMDPGTRTEKVRCTIRNDARQLRPEMFASVSIGVDTQQKLAVPRTAVVRVGDDMVAFIDRGAGPGGVERFERRVISVDESQEGTYVPVLSGLQPGERVVSSGAVVLSGSSES